MSQSLLLKPTGLNTFKNHLSAVPTGALLRAKNLVINRDNIVESRRGYKIYGNAMGGSVANTAHQLLVYKERLLRHWGSGAGQFLDYDNGSGTFTSFYVSLTGNTSNASAVITNLSTTANLSVGMYVAGTDIPANTTIASIDSNTQITMSANSAGTHTGLSLTFTYVISEVSAGTRIKSVEQNGNLYFTTSNGVKKISASSASNIAGSLITQAGGVKALDVTGQLHNSSGFLSANGAVAYRVVWGIRDNNNNLILGSPSSRIVVNNPTGSSKTVDLNITIPKSITTSHIYQIYRTPVLSTQTTFSIIGDTSSTSTNVVNIGDTSSLQIGATVTGLDIPPNTTIVSIPSLTSIVISNTPSVSHTGTTLTITQTIFNTDPGDEEQLAYEGSPAAADLTNGYVTVNDICPDSFLGAYLYTNQNSGDGILQSNDIPPLCQDITSFKGYTFYANTSTLQSIDVSLLSVSNLVSGTSKLTITDGTTTNTYTFKTQTITCDTHSNTTVDNISSTATLKAGQSISGAHFNAGTYIVSVDSANSITISQAATATAAATTFVAGYEDVANKYVMISQFATPSQQVNETALSLGRVINRQTSEIVYNYYLSGINDVPGNMLFQARSLSQVAFYLTVNDAATTGVEFSPALPSSGSVSSNTSTNEVSPNRLFYSKYQQPEAVPSVNYIDVGPKDKAIIRVLALRDNLYILKEEGVYRLTGNTSSVFTVFPFDFSTNIAAADSAVVLNNLIYMFSNQGVATISDTGVAINSRDIEDQLIKLISAQYTHFSTATFGVSYESDRAYYLFTVSNTSDTYATQCFRYNTFTQSWTTLDVSKRSGIVNVGDDKLYLSPNDVNYIEQERKSWDRTDYADRELAITLATGSVSGTTITLPSLVDVSADDVVLQTQYLTLKQFNSVLSKLDNDPVLTYHNYVKNYTGAAGLNLSNQLDLLIAQVRNDAGRQSVVGHTADASYTALIGTGSASFSALQTCYNNFITLLNNDIGVGYKNYKTSTGTVDYEFYIVSTNTINSTIVSPFAYPLIAGPITVYNHIPTDLIFVPQTLGDVSITKHISEGTFIFEDASFTKADISYSTDLSANYDTTTISGGGNGIFGNTVFGQGVFGGNGSAVPFRTYIPKGKQRARYINARFQHTVAREIFSLYGLSLTFNPMSQRGYR